MVFSWNDYSKDYQKQKTSLKGEDFLRLFCQYILPPGFTRIRHYGFLSSASKRKSLAIILHALNVNKPSETPHLTWQEIVFNRMEIQPGICKCCGGKMVVIQTFPDRFRNTHQRAPPKIISFKTTKNYISDN